MVRKMLALGAAGAIAVGLAACGGDDDGDDSSATTETAATAISEEDFVAQGNEICASGDEELDAAAEDLGPDATEDDFTQYVSDTLVPNIQGQIDAIRALGAPEGQEEDVAQFLDDAQSELDAVEADPTSVGPDSFKEVNAEAEALGLTECAD